MHRGDDDFSSGNLINDFLSKGLLIFSIEGSHLLLLQHLDSLGSWKQVGIISFPLSPFRFFLVNFHGVRHVAKNYYEKEATKNRRR